VQKNIKYLNCKNHHQIINRSRFPLVYNGCVYETLPTQNLIE
jgi:hypothetical protein